MAPVVGLLGSNSGCRQHAERGIAVVEASDQLGAVAVEHLADQRPVDGVGIEASERLGPALLPVLHDVGQQDARPSDPALEEGDAQGREPAGDPSHVERLAELVHLVAEGAHVVGRVVADRQVLVGCDLAEAAVRDQGIAQCHHLGPDRVVVVLAVEAEVVEPVRLAGSEPRRGVVGRLGDRPPHSLGDAHHLQPDLGTVAQLFDGFVRRVHGNDPTDRHAVGERAVDRGVVVVHAPAYAAA
jgi:hypothetical protein